MLVIDEVSMLSAEVWDSLERLARSLRDSNRIFGGEFDACFSREQHQSNSTFGSRVLHGKTVGLQVICCGDFFQLPPVASGSRGGERSAKLRYCFEVPSWKKIFGCVVDCWGRAIQKIARTRKLFLFHGA